MYRSPLANEIDAAIEAIDNDPVLTDDAYLVRLLEIPDLHLTALWISDGTASQYIPLGGYASSGTQRHHPIDWQELVSRLPEEPVIGISETPPPNRRPDFI